MNNYQRNLNRLRGFCDGAGVRPVRSKLEKDPDYRQGYKDGVDAKHVYSEKSAKELGVQCREIVALEL